MDKRKKAFQILSHVTAEMEAHIDVSTSESNVIKFSINKYQFSFSIPNSFNVKESAKILILQLKGDGLFQDEIKTLFDDNNELISPDVIRDREKSKSIQDLVHSCEIARISKLSHQEKVKEIKIRYGIDVNNK